MDFGRTFSSGLSYTDFLDKYASASDRQRWDDFHAHIALTSDQASLLKSFVRDMQVLVMAGAWCGDCVNQCPIFDHFAQATDKIALRFFDRDDNPELAAALQTCGAPRVPAVVLLAEDGAFCGRAGDRTLSKYRKLVSSLVGAACSTGVPDDMTSAVVQDWLNEFERIQWMLRTSGRLRQKHGDKGIPQRQFQHPLAREISNLKSQITSKRQATSNKESTCPGSTSDVHV